MIVPHEQLEPGDVIRVAAYGAEVTVMCKGEQSTETVGPLAGRPCWRYWCSGKVDEHGNPTDAAREGFMTYGPGAKVEIVARPVSESWPCPGGMCNPGEPCGCKT